MRALGVSLFLAYKSVLKGNRWALVLTVLVMGLSFVNLTFTSSILSGVMDTLNRQLVNTLLSNITISPEEDKYYLDKVSIIEAQVKQFPEVIAVAPHLTNTAFFEYKWQEKKSPGDKGKSGRWEVIGIDPSAEASVTTIHDSLIAGSYLEDGDRDQILLGVEIAGGEDAQSSQFLTLGGVNIGDKVRLTYPNGVQRDYYVKGIFRAREMLHADELSYVARREMTAVMGRTTFADRASQILVRTAPGVDESALVNQFQNLGIKGVVRGWREYGGAMRSMVSTFSIISSLIGGVGLAVAAIVMFIVVYISVVNRRRQIGILRAIGLKQNIVIGSYMAQALLYVGCGIGLGVVIVRYIAEPYFIANPLALPIGMVNLSTQPGTVQISIVGLIAGAVLAGFIPAWAIMRQSLIKAIWGS